MRFSEERLRAIYANYEEMGYLVHLPDDSFWLTWKAVEAWLNSIKQLNTWVEYSWFHAMVNDMWITYEEQRVRACMVLAYHVLHSEFVVSFGHLDQESFEMLVVLADCYKCTGVAEFTEELYKTNGWRNHPLNLDEYRNLPLRPAPDPREQI